MAQWPVDLYMYALRLPRQSWTKKMAPNIQRLSIILHEKLVENRPLCAPTQGSCLK